jgi:hypothetical protein
MPLAAQEEQGEIIIISERVGKEIDQQEREKFKLFEGINGFQSAVYIKLPDGRYFLKITYLDDETGELKISRIPQSEASIKNRGDYIDRFEEIEAKKNDEIRTSQESVYQAPGTSFYLELMGKGFYSFNVDYRKSKTKAMALGLQWVENAFITSFMYYRFRGKTYRTEIGGGFSSVVTNEGLNGVFINGVYGYRFQKKNGPLFRIGFTPLIGIPFTSKGRFVIMPWAGISFGYSL